MVFGKEVSLETEGYSDIRDITSQVQQVIGQSKAKKGIVSVTSIGSTASVSTMEFEPALAEDIRDQLEEMVPHDKVSRHSKTWGDDNGFSHIRSTLMGPGITIPFKDGQLILGTWQQIVVIDHDNRPRSRRVYVQVIGE
ncbi:MAG: secondary thiamine-phosphate synthase enzyme YjbQ [Actinomycetota bacterium]|nr:secondary thiamine-phosphate synthase enzyme YjbQ [Actinomycetota bacterium]